MRERWRNYVASKQEEEVISKKQKPTQLFLFRNKMYCFYLFYFMCMCVCVLVYDDHQWNIMCRNSNPVLIASPPDLAGMTLEARLLSYDWDNQFNKFQEATLRGTFKSICRGAHNEVVSVCKKKKRNKEIK